MLNPPQLTDIAPPDSFAGPDLVLKQVCKDCTGSTRLFDAAKVSWTTHCSYCGLQQNAAAPLGKVASVVVNRLSALIEPNPNQYSGSLDSRPVGEVIEDNLSSANQHFLDDLFQLVALAKTATSFHPDQTYHWNLRRSGRDEQDRVWESFRAMLRGKSRFFNKDAKKFLDSLFNILEDLSPNGFFFADAVMELEIGRLLYRARRGNTEEAIQRVSSNAAKELHAPPPAVTPANRMNVEGAPAFYAAFNPDTAIAEVRPSRGSNVVVGCFATTRKLRVIDFTSLKKNAAPAFSIWGDDFVDRSQKRGLLLRLQDRIARPIPLGMEHEYLDTQVVADYLHSYLGFDGAMFESSQKSGGTNIVLFGATLGTYSTESRSFLDAPLLFKENSVEVHEVIEIEIRAKRVR